GGGDTAATAVQPGLAGPGDGTARPRDEVHPTRDRAEAVRPRVRRWPSGPTYGERACGRRGAHRPRPDDHPPRDDRGSGVAARRDREKIGRTHVGTPVT